MHFSMKPEKALPLMGWIFAVVGLVLLAVGVVLTARRPPEEDRIYTQATIVSIEQRYGHDSFNSNRNSEHLVIVEYEVDGQRYAEKLDYYSSSMREGDAVQIYTVPGRPDEPRSKAGDTMLTALLCGLGGLFALVGLILVIRQTLRRSRDARLKETGQRVYADYVQTKYLYLLRINGRSPYVIECSWTDRETQKTYRFQSEYLFDDPKPALERKGVRTIPVYIDPARPERYAMDLSGILDQP